MEIIKRFGKQLAVGLSAIGMLLIALSIILSRQPISAEIWLDGVDQPVTILVENSLAANWLLEAGIHLFPNDRIGYDGIPIPYDFNLPKKNGQHLVYKPAVPVTVQTADESTQFYSGAETLGEALWEHNIFLKVGDDLSLPISTPLNQAVVVSLLRSQPVRIQLDKDEIEVSVSSITVGEALAEAGIPLQFLDYSVPAEEQQIPADRTIRVVRVSEEVVTEEMVIPYNVERISDPQMNIGDEQILQTGENGVQSAIMHLRYEDGKEVSRTVLAEWVSKAPVTQRIAYGGNVVVKTFDSSEGAVDYWLALDVYITSYLDTGSPTASGIWPYYGAIAVPPKWYPILKGTSIYVPGYGVGTVLDICPGCVGKPWIDVFIPTDQYVGWSRTETIYFLPPAPENFTGELP
ncbi:MAG: G5 domain-containing protein [Anaerolineaceae bacterium]|nr:G5 domain-containing protein [Anaerolineaceae bacterium]